MPKKAKDTQEEKIIIENKKTNATSMKKASASTKKKTTSISKTKTTTKKVSSSPSSKRTKTKKIEKKEDIQTLEYYDLPYRYNQTIVKILAQTPSILFVYWDISDKDKEEFIKKYGDNFFNETKPFLLVHNTTMNYTFESEINDFANSWYLHIQNPNCEYNIELIRKPIENSQINEDIIKITSSNNLDTPNDHILFEKEQNMIYFKNVKTNTIYSKNVSNLQLLRNMGKIYNIYEVYKELYKDENIIDNPSSGFNIK